MTEKLNLETIERQFEEFSVGPVVKIVVRRLIARIRELERAQPAGEAVGQAVPMPGTDGGFTMACFEASNVPIGTKVYAAPPAAANQAGIPEDAYEIFLRAYHLGKPLDEAFSQGLRAALSKTEIPNGWKLAPIEPTYTMKDAPKKDRPGFSRVVATEVWRAMLAAAPHTESHALGGGDGVVGNGET
jgi:hypothetical protein